MLDSTDRRIRDRIRAEMQARGLTHERLALEVGVPRSHITRILSGSRARQSEVLLRMLEALDLELRVEQRE